MKTTIDDVREIAAESAREIVAECLKYAVLHGKLKSRDWLEDYLGEETRRRIAGQEYDLDDFWSLVVSNHEASDPVRYDEGSCGDSNSANLDDVMAEHADRILTAIWNCALLEMLDEVTGNREVVE